jgi:hypothetical protein
MKLRRLICLATLVPALAVFAAGCEEDSPTGPSGNPNQVRFTAQLSPANEVPPVTNAEASGIGTAAITLDVTRDAGGTITGATATFQIALSGFPAGTPMNIAHIHEGGPTCACPVVVNTGLAAGQVVLTNGAGSFTRSGINVSAALAQGIVNNPSGYYFNVHSTLNPGGAVRGVLVKVS